MPLVFIFFFVQALKTVYVNGSNQKFQTDLHKTEISQSLVQDFKLVKTKTKTNHFDIKIFKCVRHQKAARWWCRIYLYEIMNFDLLYIW